MFSGATLVQNVLLLISGVAVLLLITFPVATQPIAVLEGRALLASNTLAAGPTSGNFIGTTPINGVTPPFAGQPVQGFSAVIRTSNTGEYWAMPDNGYGSKASSPDFNLRAYRITPDFKTATGGTGNWNLGTYIELADPDRKISFTLTNNTGSRVLTGADFDIESMRVVADGSIWFGDEFGPWLLHTDATGKVLEAPILMPGNLKSPNSQNLGTDTASVPNSRGFEGMALSADGTKLYPMLEGALVADTDKRRRVIYEFDLTSKSYTANRWDYRVDSPGYNTPELVSVSGSTFLVVERDSLVGAAALFKKVFAIDLKVRDCAGYLIKTEVLDMMNISDPTQISQQNIAGEVGVGTTFTFPYETIEALLPLDSERVLIMNDNNYPNSANRNPGIPDYNEAVIVRTGGLKPTATVKGPCTP